MPAEKLGLEKEELEKLQGRFRQHGFEDFRWMDPAEITVAQWVRTKCMFGCGLYGRCASCPPNVPSVAECERFFKEYGAAAVFHFPQKLDDPEARHAWSGKVNRRLSKLEREIFLTGYEKVFLLFMDSCHFCKTCSGERSSCQDPRFARPSPEGMAVDVYTTVRKLGYPIAPLAEYEETMNRYAFLLLK